MSRLRITDRTTGTVLGDVDPAADVDPTTAPAAAPADPPRAAIEPLGAGRFEVVVDGWRFDLLVEDADRADLRARATRGRDAGTQHGPIEVRAIIPGRIASVAVAVGDVVEAGTRLLAVEAMKMENDVRAPRAGTIERVAVAAGQTVELGDVLVVLA